MSLASDPLAFTTERPKHVQQQLWEHVRALIVQGALQPGAKLPTTKELAAKWSVPVTTVQTALTHLVKEGLLVRIRKKGTFVREPNERLTHIGAYYDASVWSPDGSSFRQAVHLELRKLCEARDIKLEPFFDERKPAERTTPLPELLYAIETHRIHAVIATDVAVNEATWIDKLPVPAGLYVEAHYPAKVDLDFDQFVELGVRKLKSAGCRSAGIISLRGPWKPAVRASRRPMDKYPGFDEAFSRVCAECDIQTSSDWIRTAGEFVQGKAQQQFGYEEFLRIWKGPQRPEGLIVYPNTCASGAITGVLEKRVEVPAQLKLVLHKHRELDYLCPLDVSFLYTSVADVAHALLQQVIAQFEGATRTQVTIPFSEEVEAANKTQGKRRK